jgi:hypothetical protein
MIHMESMFNVPRWFGLSLQKAVPLAGAKPKGSHMFARC